MEIKYYTREEDGNEMAFFADARQQFLWTRLTGEGINLSPEQMWLAKELFGATFVHQEFPWNEKEEATCERCSDTLSPEEIKHGEGICFPCLKNEEE